MDAGPRRTRAGSGVGKWGIGRRKTARVRVTPHLRDGSPKARSRQDLRVTSLCCLSFACLRPAPDPGERAVSLVVPAAWSAHGPPPPGRACPGPDTLQSRPRPPGRFSLLPLACDSYPACPSRLASRLTEEGGLDFGGSPPRPGRRTKSATLTCPFAIPHGEPSRAAVGSIKRGAGAQGPSRKLG